MTEREKIHDQIARNNTAIQQLKNDNLELERANVLLSDEKQWFDEKVETVYTKQGRKRISTEKLIGRVHWNENFKDEDTGDVITVERTAIVRIDGIWQ